MSASARKLDRLVFGKLKSQFHEQLASALDDCDSLLDVGCGANSPIQFLPRRAGHSVGVDLFEPWIAKSETAAIHDEYVAGDALDLDTIFQPGSFDGVLALDLIEHLTKEDGLRLLAMMERLARKKTVVFTPNGFLEQHETEDNALQVHKSGWTAKEMRSLGYHVVGINGWRPLRAEYAQPRWRPRLLWNRVSYLSQLVTTSRPDSAFAILCMKSVG
jgi:SAM-dependent methyltransferase